MKLSEVPNELAERGVWWQVAGFAIFCTASAVILGTLHDSEAPAYRYFEITVTKLYWALIIPLAGLFEGVRTMFHNIRKQKEYAYRLGYEQARRDLGVPPEQPVSSASRVAAAIARFGVEEDGVVKIPADTLAVIRFMAAAADNPQPD